MYNSTMTLKENFISKVKALFDIADRADVSIEAEVRDVVEALNALRSSRGIFKIAIQEGDSVNLRLISWLS